ncbi:MAG: site-specific integrase [Devosia sp.]|uniref:site-specific integrase n=1 Tax=Devosia sp. TaxID=1871048 RepID=UPI001AC3FFA2|nr:site-specific integrase [Devosia sp.]MBN9317028.1 site-specific integrase [Devosia sp.]
MGKYPGLMLRGSVFYYRKRVPEDVRNRITSNPERWGRLSVNPGAPFHEWRELLHEDGTARELIMRSLRTGDRREAERRYLKTAHDVAHVLDAILSRMSAEEPKATDDDLRALALQYFGRRQTAIDDALEALGADHETMVSNWRDDLIELTNGNPLSEAPFLSLAESTLEKAGYIGDPNAAFILGGYLRRAEKSALERRVFGVLPPDETDTMFVGSAGRLSHPEPARPSETNPRRLVSLRDVHTLYKAKKQQNARSSKTINGYDYIWSLIEDCFDVSKPMSAVTRDETARFEQVLRRLPPNWRKKPDLARLSAPQASAEAARLGLKPIAANTLYGYLSDLAAFFRWAEKEDYVGKSVAHGLAEKPTGPRRPGRLEFAPHDLLKVFGSQYRQLARKNGAAKPPPISGELPDDPRYWVPLVSLFTGLRLGEICQLTRKEVTKIGGIPCIVTMWDVWDETEYSDREEEEIVRSQKTEAALRAIPIVDELIRLGFWEFAQRLPEGSSRRLFPSLKPDRHGYIAAPVSRWFSRYRKKAGVTDSRKVFHSLRHTFRSAMRRAEVSHDVAVKIGGWSAKGLGDHYGTDNLVKLSREQLNRIEYDGLDLSHLYPAVRVPK